MEKTACPSGTRKTIGGITLIALFAALISAGAFVSIPLPFSPIPVVLQNLFTILAGLCLGPIRGSLAVLLYLLAGALGAPVFAGATGGFTRFLGPTGGYLLGYPLTALIAGLIAGRPRSEKPVPSRRLIPAVVLGLLSMYIPGILWLKRYTNFNWSEVFITGALPFFIGDTLKGIVAVIAAPRLRRIIAELLP
jgi:biotin transport system substrate-specific component